MYESYEELMERKLAMTQDKRDRRQGSLIFDAMGPNAAETAAFYADLTMLENRTFADTATGDDLTRRCAERGVMRKEATKATFYGSFTDAEGEAYPLKQGERFYLEPYYYQVLMEENGRVVLECETAGEDGNSYLGTLLPVNHLEGLAEAKLTELRTDGEDAESDDMLRKRYMDSFSADAFGGNIADYKLKVGALQNVGGVKVYPVWQGGGTVKLVIIDQGWKAPTEMELTWQADADTESGKREIQERIEAYLLELRKTWAEAEYLIVRISYLESAALAATGVLDVQNCTINGQESNLQMQADEIPVLEGFEVVA